MYCYLVGAVLAIAFLVSSVIRHEHLMPNAVLFVLGVISLGMFAEAHRMRKQ